MADKATIIPALYPVVYTGPKDYKEQIVPGSPRPLVFKLDENPDSEFHGLKVAYATEREARWMDKMTTGIFDFPSGTHSADDKNARITALEEQVAELMALVKGEPIKRTRRTKAEMAADLAAV